MLLTCFRARFLVVMRHSPARSLVASLISPSNLIRRRRRRRLDERSALTRQIRFQPLGARGPAIIRLAGEALRWRLRRQPKAKFAS